MSTAVTMQELEFETAELLPNRETLSCRGSHPSFTVTQAGQFGLVNVGPIASGNNVLSGIGLFGSGVANGGGNVGIGNL
jgi:hypothetical protein